MRKLTLGRPARSGCAGEAGASSQGASLGSAGDKGRDCTLLCDSREPEGLGSKRAEKGTTCVSRKHGEAMVWEGGDRYHEVGPNRSRPLGKEAE